MRTGSGRAASGVPTFFSWALRQPSPKKEAYLQVFTGVPEVECARNLHLSLEQLDAILLEACDPRLAFAEDVYLVSLAMTKSREEFCRMTGQSESIYKLVCMRRNAALALERSRKTAGPPDKSHPPNARDQRREARRAAREEGRVTREEGLATREICSPSTHAAQAAERVQSGCRADDLARSRSENRPGTLPSRRLLSEHERSRVLEEAFARVLPSLHGDSPVAFADFERDVLSACVDLDLPSAQAPESGELRRLLDKSGKAVWANEAFFWPFEWRTRSSTLKAAVEKTLSVNREYSVRLFFIRRASFLQQLEIASPRQLHDILRKVYAREKDVAFGPDLSICFGKVNRRSQVRSFAANHAGDSEEAIAGLYGQAYGFEKELALQWVKDYAADVGRSAGLASSVAVAGRSSASSKTTATRSVPRRRSLLTEEEMAFLRAELVRPCCDALLVQRRFSFRFPGRDSLLLRGDVLLELGRYEDGGLLFSLDTQSSREYFESLLASTPFFSKGDVGFETAVMTHPAFKAALKGRLKRFQTLVYDKDCYVTIKRLKEVTDVSFLLVSGYGGTVRSKMDGKGPFTIHSLRQDEDFCHPLHDLELPDAFYESLIDLNDFTKSCVLGGTRIFTTDFGEKDVPRNGSRRQRFSAADFVKGLVAQAEGIDLDALGVVLAREYGIDCPEATLLTTLYNARVYHDDVNDTYYTSMERWKQEVRDELA